MLSKCAWAALEDSSWQWPPTSSGGFRCHWRCNRTVCSSKQKSCQNCYLLWWCYTLVIVTPVLPQHGPCACLSLPLLTTASGWLKHVTSSFTSLPLTRKRFPIVVATVWGFSHSTEVCDRIPDRVDLCNQMAATPMGIKSTSSHAVD